MMTVFFCGVHCIDTTPVSVGTKYIDNCEVNVNFYRNRLLQCNMHV